MFSWIVNTFRHRKGVHTRIATFRAAYRRPDPRPIEVEYTGRELCGPRCGGSYAPEACEPGCECSRLKVRPALPFGGSYTGRCVFAAASGSLDALGDSDRRWASVERYSKRYAGMHPALAAPFAGALTDLYKQAAQADFAGIEARAYAHMLDTDLGD